MRVELNRSQLRVSFLWGDGQDVPEGHIVVRWNNFDEGRGADKAEIYRIPHAREYWKQLVDAGFKVHPISC